MSATTQTGGVVPPLLKEAWPRNTSKHAARAAGVAFETARDWVRGRSRPLAETLLEMAARDDAMADALRRRLDDMRADRACATAPMDRAPPVTVTR
jgi:hypothetical protein